MQNPPILVDGRVDDGMSGAAVFGLDVEDLVADLDVGVETGAHRSPGSFSMPRQFFENPIIREFI
jgi:hypothetical protein